MILCIVGPTGVGKTKLSVALAKKYNAIIINADSMQVYKGLDIGTAKIKESERQENTEAKRKQRERNEESTNNTCCKYGIGGITDAS